MPPPEKLQPATGTNSTPGTSNTNSDDRLNGVTDYSSEISDAQQTQDEAIGKNLFANVEEEDTNDRLDSEEVVKTDEEDGSLLFRVPDWGYQDYIRERTAWQKGYDSATGEPGWFYFKIFFRFDTNNGLLGGLLPEENDRSEVTNIMPNTYNCALRYLTMNKDHYTNMDIEGRIEALKKFGSILSFINGHAPWFFDSIGGLDKATTPNINEPYKSNELELGFKEDAVDMRVTNLIDLYKYAAYDLVEMKEVLPENLRMFDMTIVLFHTPLRWYHTGMKTMRRGTFPYKSLSDSNFENRMSYKMYTFKGCEFDYDQLGNVYPGEMNNQQPFNMGNAKIRINYKRVYQHTFNEWGQFMIGDDGIYYDNAKNKPKRISAILDAKNNPYYFNLGADVFKPLVDASESRITWAMKKLQPGAIFGNLYLEYTDINSKYYKNKLKTLKHGAKHLH